MYIVEKVMKSFLKIKTSQGKLGTCYIYIFKATIDDIYIYTYIYIYIYIYNLFINSFIYFPCRSKALLFLA